MTVARTARRPLAALLLAFLVALPLLALPPARAWAGASVAGDRSPAGPADSSPAAPGDWTQFRFSPDHRAVNRSETILSPSTVSGLGVKWATSTPLVTSTSESDRSEATSS